jgi:hypothetical protein
VDALDVLRVCLRRWYVVLPVIILALGAGFGSALQQKPTYTAIACYALVFQNPGASSDPRERNPLADDDATLLGEVLATNLMSGPSQLEFGGVDNSGVAPGQANDDGSSYSVTRRPCTPVQSNFPQSSGSYVVQTWGKDPEGVRNVVDSVLAAASERAAAIQDRAGAPERSQYTTFVTSPAQVVELPPTSRIKFLVAVLGIGILAGSALALVVDRVTRSRKEKRAVMASSAGSTLVSPVEDVASSWSWSTPPWCESSMEGPVLASTSDPLAHPLTRGDQDALPGRGEKPSEVNGKPARGTAASLAHRRSSAESIPEAEWRLAVRPPPQQ